MLDSVGKKVNIGDFISYGGKGNVDAEYGMITGKVIDIDENKNKVKIQRLSVDYKPQLTIKIITTFKEAGKFVVVEPLEIVKDFFNGIPNSCTLKKCIEKWLHKGVLDFSD